MASEAYSGSATIGTTEYDCPSASTSIGAVATSGIYQVFVDLNALTASDRFRLRIYEKCRSGDTQRLVHEATYVGVLPDPIAVTPALLLMHGWTVTLQKLQGTDRAIAWSIRRA